MVTIDDDYGKKYKILNLQEFKNHLQKYHSINGKGDDSLHEDYGYFFKVTREFYSYIMSLNDD